MNRLLALVMTLVLLAGLSACGKKDREHDETQRQTLPQSLSADKETTQIKPETYETITEEDIYEESMTEKSVTEETINSEEVDEYYGEPEILCDIPTEHGNNLQIKKSDLNDLLEFAPDLIFGGKYDSSSDSGEVLLHYGMLGNMMNHLCELYGYPQSEIYETGVTPDPLGLIHHDKNSDDPAKNWGWMKIEKDTAEFFVENVFDNHLSKTKKPQDTIEQGYYYLDGFYYICVDIGGLDGDVGPQITKCFLNDSGNYEMTLVWRAYYDHESFNSVQIEAGLHQIDRHRMWTIYKVR